eukprot:CAMPEP_0176110556 /NCGR_PEP_ID=MMETSP0120_2-20121206/55515_1 /TAXON_ID=160619 /ORGANISM="Kryptoperidinium foliaceum, Strain CCMP 1326" /LENGTH=375 /DNA_ID=CAMNT_0017444763 /DNA_START=15 /DNA_END=1142 /DNA_ORIENTATION=+
MDTAAMARARAENERLREENARLRAILETASPDTLCDLAAADSAALTAAASAAIAGVGDGAAGAGGTVEVADRLVQLMKEGGQLLKEREALQVENAHLESELLQLVEDDAPDDFPERSDVAAAILAEHEAEIAALRAEADADASCLDSLIPLLGEEDALYAEREKLTSERGQLLGSLEVVCARAAGQEPSPSPSPSAGAGPQDAVGDAAGSQDLAARLQCAVEEVKKETGTLEEEVRRLRDDNTRLRQEARQPTPRAPPSIAREVAPRTKFCIQPGSPTSRKVNAALRERMLKTPAEGAYPAFELTPLTEEEIQDRQKEAMATLLKGALPRSSVVGVGDKRPESPLKLKARAPEKMEYTDFASRNALHTLFQSFK